MDNELVHTLVAGAVELIDVSAAIPQVKASLITVATTSPTGTILPWAALIIASSNTR